MLSQRAKAFSIECLLKEDSCGRKSESRGSCQITAELCHGDLWQAFNALGTEMIITKTGRRMFPALRVKFRGLKPDSCYRISIHFVSIDQNKYRYVYHSSKWMVAGPGDQMMPGQVYEHSDSPLEGIHLDGQVVSFERIKLTNSNIPKEGQISLVSMQKFQPRIRITEVFPGNLNAEKMTSPGEDLVFAFPQTSFMAVTAYQNQEITRLKIARNPFAKGFREAGKTRSSLDAIMASFRLSLSSKMPSLRDDKLGHIKSEAFCVNHGQLQEQTTVPSTSRLPPSTSFLHPVALSWCGFKDPVYPPPPAHVPGLYSLELCSKERDDFTASTLLLQQYSSSLKTMHTCGSRGFGSSLECQSSPAWQSHNRSLHCDCSCRTVMQDDTQLNMTDVQEQPAGKRCHPGDAHEGTDKRPKSEEAY
ncbi:T-box transcription factor TBX18-like [Liolophura sinensis]|uniref:T-box transcription factor TBX18-like n=1 Tax=Liolophura sinensis TaxID=3198878 RepID=UPI003158B511